MKIVNGELISIEESDIKNGVLNLGYEVEKIGDYFDISNFEIVKIIAPALERVGNDSFRSNDSFTSGEFPMLASVGDYSFRSNNSFTSGEFPMLASVGNDSFSFNDSFTSGEFPMLASVGNDSFRFNDSFTSGEFPMLASVGNDSFRFNNSLVSIKTKKHDLKTKNVDGFLFIIENEKKSKGIKIYSGYNFVSMSENVINKQFSFVAEKDGFTAHGGTIKKAISDLEFKIVSEKLKKEPIKKDTLFTVMYYRTLTGACDLGCRSWMLDNGIDFDIIDGETTVEKKPILAKDLLVYLEKSKPYGYDKLKKLVTF